MTFPTQHKTLLQRKTHFIKERWLCFYAFFQQQKLPRADCLLYSIWLVGCLYSIGLLCLHIKRFRSTGTQLHLLWIGTFFWYLHLFISICNFHIYSGQPIHSFVTLDLEQAILPRSSSVVLQLLNLIFQSTQIFYESCTFKFPFSWKILTQNFLI